MRGKEKQDNTVFGEVGITPACAGKRKIRALRASCTGDHPRVCGEKEVIPLRRCTIVLDHPRVCGEKSCSFSFLPKRAGSPPRVRGKVASSAASPISRRDHPRVCGEKFDTGRGFCIPSGSPPRVRGKVGGEGVPEAVQGITPACAGKRLRKPRKINAFRNSVQRFSFSFSNTAWVMRQSSRARCVRVVSMPRCAARVVSL